jgi:hypothetical protein
VHNGVMAALLWGLRGNALRLHMSGEGFGVALGFHLYINM